MKIKTFNFIEAVNSGKRFRAIGNMGHKSKWYEVSDGRIDIESGGSISCASIDFINKSFEIEEKTITITESEFNAACTQTDKAWDDTKVDFNSHLAKLLGF